MYAVIRKNRDGRIQVLRTCHSRESVMIACRLQKEIAPREDRNNVKSVIMDDAGGWMEILAQTA